MTSLLLLLVACGGAEINILSYGTSWEFLFAEQTGDPIDDALYYRNLETEKEALSLFQQSVLAGDASYDVFAFKSYALGSIFTQDVLCSWDDIEGMDLEQP